MFSEKWPFQTDLAFPLQVSWTFRKFTTLTKNGILAMPTDLQTFAALHNHHVNVRTQMLRSCFIIVVNNMLWFAMSARVNLQINTTLNYLFNYKRIAWVPWWCRKILWIHPESLIEQWSFYTHKTLVGWFPCCWLQWDLNPPGTWVYNLMWWFFPLYQRKTPWCSVNTKGFTQTLEMYYWTVQAWTWK